MVGWILAETAEEGKEEEYLLYEYSKFYRESSQTRSDFLQMQNTFSQTIINSHRIKYVPPHTTLLTTWKGIVSLIFDSECELGVSVFHNLRKAPWNFQMSWTSAIFLNFLSLWE